jgi:hypothetical protein
MEGVDLFFARAEILGNVSKLYQALPTPLANKKAACHRQPAPAIDPGGSRPSKPLKSSPQMARFSVTHHAHAHFVHAHHSHHTESTEPHLRRSFLQGCCANYITAVWHCQPQIVKNGSYDALQ